MKIPAVERAVKSISPDGIIDNEELQKIILRHLPIEKTLELCSLLLNDHFEEYEKECTCLLCAKACEIQAELGVPDGK